MKRDTLVQLVAALVLAACLLGSGLAAVNITGYASAAKLTYTDRAEEGQPPEVALGIAMGAFRGIFVNFLWIRAEDMKQAGKYYEANQLATAITKLQPRFPRVWVFHGWNLAYNISVGTQTPDERWAWVNSGISLLRDKGIPANPNDMLLHKELAWIFLHKVGGFTDDANIVYKKRLAQEWQIVLGPPPRRTSEDRKREAAIEKYASWLEGFEQAPLTLEQCIAAEPSVRTLLDRIHTELGTKPEESPEKIYELLFNYERVKAMSTSVLLPLYETTLGPRSKVLMAMANDPQLERAWAALLKHWRRRVVVELYHMEPSRMARYTREHGPMDWRHHASHSLYWAKKGVEAGLSRVDVARNKSDFDFINTDRVVAQSIQDLFRTGEIYFDFLGSFNSGQTESFFQGIPNPHFVQSYAEVLDAMAERSWADNKDARGYSPLASGYENFVREAITFFYRRGQIDEAQKWVKNLLETKHFNLNDPDRRMLLEQPLEVFVTRELQGELTRPAILVNQTISALMGAYAGGLLGGDPDLFLSQFNYAIRVHKVYMEEQLKNTPAAGGDRDRMEQLASDFRMVAGATFYQFITGLNLDDARVVYQAAPNTLRLYAYTYLLEAVKPEMDKIPGASFAQAFPEPQGYKEWFEAERRKLMEEMRRNRAPVEQK
ncbi:MAG TPA: hypothetical protein VD997_15290 [Phycisphaerales bacterium]|nr:hypothetical protein [Phycisphaerales bacterium]